MREECGKGDLAVMFRKLEEDEATEAPLFSAHASYSRGKFGRERLGGKVLVAQRLRTL